MPEEPATFIAHTCESGPPQLLREHLLQVSELAAKHAGKVGAGAAGAVIGLLHDIGKYSAAFQEYLRKMGSGDDTEPAEAARGRIDHSTAGAQAIWAAMKARGVWEGIVGEILALCIASHHTGMIDSVSPNGVNNLVRRMKKEDSATHGQEAWGNAERVVVEKHEQGMERPELVDGIAERIRSIWIQDSEEEIRSFKIGLLTRLLFSCLIDADRTDTADSCDLGAAVLRQHGCYTGWEVLTARLEAELVKMPASSLINELRRSVSDDCLLAAERPKGAYTLTVPTGGGKTLASLRFALQHANRWEMDRLVFVSPFTSIIDQNADAVRAILEPMTEEFGSVVLEHHSNLTPLKQTWRSKVLSENWDAPVVFTTAVQLLEALFGAGTRGVRRMHQLARAVVVFDEIQTLPVRCVHLFNNAMNFLVEQCGSSVVLCTATQPLLHKVDQKKGALRLGSGSEIINEAAALFKKVKRYETHDCRKAGGWEYGEAAELALKEVETAGSCMVVVNTKREARSIFQECQSRAGFEVAAHLSTSMCPAHRLAVLNSIKRRLLDRKPTLCVSTQLIEAGVDISFGSVVRALAGIDSIAQAAGRCNRHGESPLGHVFVVNLAGGIPKQLRDIKAAQEAAQRVLDEHNSPGNGGNIDLDNPEVIERFYQYYFHDRRLEMDYPVGPREAERNDTLLRMLGANSLAAHSRSSGRETYMQQAFMTAAAAFEPIDSDTRGVIVPYAKTGREVIAELCAAHEPKQQYRLLKQAQRYSVNVFPQILKALEEAGAVHEVREGTGILYLEGRHYDAACGLDIEGKGEMEFHDV